MPTSKNNITVSDTPNGENADKGEKTKSKRLQMADIARLAGVSTATVSRALAGSPNIREETRIRIEELARALNYSVNFAAQNLRLKDNRTIAVVIPYNQHSRQHLTDPFFLTMLGSLADALTELNYEMLLSRIDEDQLDHIEQLYRTGRAAGIIVIGQWHHHEQLNTLASHRVPLVVWGAQQPQQLYCTIGSDNIEGGRQATTHLLQRGCRRILFLGDVQLPEVAHRHQGYLQAHEQAVSSLDPALTVAVPFAVDDARATLDALMRQGLNFDGVFATSDVLAMTVISVLGEYQHNVPGDIAVVGYDGIELAAHFLPALTTVSQPIQEAARVMVDTLLRTIQGESTPSRQLPAQLVVRASA